MAKGKLNFNKIITIILSDMGKIIVRILFIGMMSMVSLNIKATGVDAVRAKIIESTSKLLEKSIEAEIGMQALETTGHVWIRSEVETTTNFQRQFNDYLDTFHNMLSLAAEVYGIYYEITRTSKNLKSLSDVVAASPSNVLAVAFSARRGTVYRDLIKASIDIVMDVKKLFDNSKMTEQERNNIVSGVRPKLHRINLKLTQLTFAIRYTSFLDVWNEVLNRTYTIDPRKKTDIIEKCRREWKSNAISIR